LNRFSFSFDDDEFSEIVYVLAGLVDGVWLMMRLIARQGEVGGGVRLRISEASRSHELVVGEASAVHVLGCVRA